MDWTDRPPGRWTTALLFMLWLAALLCATSGPAAAAGTFSLAPEEQAWLEAHPTIRIGVMDAWAPLDFRDEHGQPTGIGAALLHAMDKRLGGHIEIVSGPWSEIYEQAQGGQLDALLDVTPKPEREAYFDFTTPYLSIPHVIVAPVDAPYLASEESLAGKRLALEKDFGNVDYFRQNYPDVTVLEYRDTEHALGAMASGEADAYAGNRAVAIYLMRHEVMTNLKVHGRLQKPGSILAIGVHKGEPLLTRILQKAQDPVVSEEMPKILDEWVGTQPSMQTSVPLTAAEREWLSHHPRLRLGVDPDWPPFEFVDNKGHYGGIASGFVAEVVDRLGIEMVPLPGLTWDQAQDAMVRRDVDVLPMVSPTDSRRRSMDFTRPYISFPAVIVTRRDSTFVTSLDDLEGRRVGVVSGYLTQEGLEKDHPEIQSVPLATVAEVLKAIDERTVDAGLLNLAAATHAMEQLRLDDLKIAAPSDYQFDLAMGVRKDWPELVGILDKALAGIDEGTRSTIQNRWINVQYEFGVTLRSIALWGGGAAALLLAIIGLISFWNRQLNRKVQEREVALNQKAHDLGERVKEMTCLYSFSSVLEQHEPPLQEVLQQAVELLPAGWHYPELTCARITYGELLVETPGFRRTSWVQSAPFQVRGAPAGLIEVVYLELRPTLDEGPFLKEERQLID